LNHPNKTRADFAENYEELIESYNAGSRNIGDLFEESLKFTRSMNEEQQRHAHARGICREGDGRIPA
jgi:hypothetical protein